MLSGRGSQCSPEPGRFMLHQSNTSGTRRSPMSASVVQTDGGVGEIHIAQNQFPVVEWWTWWSGGGFWLSFNLICNMITAVYVLTRLVLSHQVHIFAHTKFQY